MKKLSLIILMFTTFSMFSQVNQLKEASSGCRCSSTFGSCTTKCGDGQLASCEETWYFGCSCRCQETLDFTYQLNLYNVEQMYNLLEKIDYVNLDELKNLIHSLKQDSNNFVYKTKDFEDYNKNFIKLRNFYEAMPPNLQFELIKKIKNS
ncbi:hypothetical protein [Psychroflexus sp. MBR-150]|jgi:hypothetical protein